MITHCSYTGHRVTETRRLVRRPHLHWPRCVVDAVHGKLRWIMRRAFAVAITFVALIVGAPFAAAQTCGSHRLAVQILGSGGPFPSSSASTGYIVWLDGRSVVLVDAGGGVFLRFGESGARIEELEFLAISHLHPDHVSDLPALLWLTGTRSAPLRIAGPSGNQQFPAFANFLSRLIGNNASAFPILSRRSNGSQGGSVPVQAQTVDVARQEPTSLVTGGPLQITALGVPHTAPSLAYRVSVGDASVVFGSDQNGSNPRFISFASRADVLVMHFAISTSARGTIAENHAPPAVVGDVAARVNPRRLVLSHITKPLASDTNGAVYSGYDQATLMTSLSAVRMHYQGLVTMAEDLQCIVVRD
jgi:ribonuclease BN (tRNA processing enzyme)